MFLEDLGMNVPTVGRAALTAKYVWECGRKTSATGN